MKSITPEQLLKNGFKEQKCVFTGRHCWVRELYSVPHIDCEADRFVLYSDTMVLKDFKYDLPSKVPRTMKEINEYIKNSKYYD